MEEKGKIVMEFTEDELNLIFKVFSDLEREALINWRSLVESEQERSPKSNKLWLLAGMYHAIQCYVGKMIGKEVSVKDYDDEIRLAPFELYKKNWGNHKGEPTSTSKEES